MSEPQEVRMDPVRGLWPRRGVLTFPAPVVPNVLRVALATLLRRMFPCHEEGPILLLHHHIRRE